MPSETVNTIVVIGGGMAGLRTAEGLRADGYAERLVLLSEEPHPAYDRPPLSKGFIKGEVDQDAITFVPLAQLREQGIEFIGASAVSLDARAHEVRTAGASISYDRAVIATGATPRRVPGVSDDRQPPMLRTIDDAIALREQLLSARTVAVIGGGLIGCEIAATSRSLGLDVTLIEAGPTLMLRSFGAQLGGTFEQLHRHHGARVITGIGVADLTPPSADQEGWEVTLVSGETFTSDVVVAGIGADPSIGWLSGSGLTVENGVVCDETLTTSDGDVMAVGDVARFHIGDGAYIRTEQWLSAVDQARHVAGNILRPHDERTAFPLSDYFWTDQYGLKIQGVGTHQGAELVFEQADAEANAFLVKAVRDEKVVGVYAAGFAREFARARRMLSGPIATG